MILKIRKDVYNAISHQVGSGEAEDGGICGADNDNIISAFVFDAGTSACPGKYSPDVKHLNQVLKEWSKTGIRFCAFVHSHPMGSADLSVPDIQYAERILTCFDYLERLYLLLVIYESKASKRLMCYCINKFGKDPETVVLQIVK